MVITCRLAVHILRGKDDLTGMQQQIEFNWIWKLQLAWLLQKRWSRGVLSYATWLSVLPCREVA
jgi:hypothetical protein